MSGTPIERAHDQWAAQYLIAVLLRDNESLISLLTDIERGSFWDRFDALGAAARDVILTVTSEADATAILQIRDALAESTSASDPHPG